MRKFIILSLLLALPTLATASPQKATLTEGKTSMLTYGFSDPNPVANPDLLQYPYFRFDGYESVGKQKEWKTVVMENDWISVTVFPEIGGKVWGAIDKTRGLEFVYYNHVVKFRDIAMRGAWTSGGIEFNFGIIGHIPSTATPVDYMTRENSDGSVSCLIASFELLTRTWWTVEINVPSDKAYFTTTARYINTSPLDQPYYNWMNAAYAMGVNINRSFTDYGWCAHIRGVESGGVVESLPTHTFPSMDGGVTMKCPTEIAITDRREAELSNNGFLPLCHWKNTDYAVFIGDPLH